MSLLCFFNLKNTMIMTVLMSLSNNSNTFGSSRSFSIDCLFSPDGFCIASFVIFGHKTLQILLYCVLDIFALLYSFFFYPHLRI